MHNTWARLLVMDMTNPEVPRLKIRLTRSALSRRADSRSLRMAFFPVRNFSTHSAEQAWEITVASAAPFTPMSSRKMKIGSNTMLTTAPTATVIMPMRLKPWALMNGFIPKLIITKRVPKM